VPKKKKASSDTAEFKTQLRAMIEAVSVSMEGGQEDRRRSPPTPTVPRTRRRRSSSVQSELGSETGRGEEQRTRTIFPLQPFCSR
jgi:hypothetical protein